MKFKRLVPVLVIVAAMVGAVGVAASVATPGPLDWGARQQRVVGNSPAAIATGDFDNDGDADLAVPNFYSGSVSVLIGNGGGGFGAASNFDVGANPTCVGIEDFNSDFNADIAVSTLADDSISMLLGDGAGGFSLGTTVTVGDDVYAIDSADFNGDGSPDIAAPGYSDNTVSILLGNGLGGFSFGTTLTAAVGPYRILAQDLNGDSKTDLVTANWSSADVSVFRGNGLGGFSFVATVPAGPCPGSLAAADFTSDGNLDLAVANREAPYGVTILRGDGACGLSFESTVSTASDPWSVGAADLDGDGNEDLAASNYFANQVVVFRGDGLGHFTQDATTLDIPGAAAPLLVADFNKDYKPDVAVGQWSSSNIHTFQNRTRFDATLDLYASRTVVPYKSTVALTGLLLSDWRLLTGRTDVQVWRKTVFDADYRYDGTLTYDTLTGFYTGVRGLGETTTFQLRCPGGTTYASSVSPNVVVACQASLGKPVVPATVRRNTYFTTYGSLKPRHSTRNATKLSFYRKVLARWVLYRTVIASQTNYTGYTRYSLSYKLPYAGSWQVKASHADSSHASTTSAPTYFTVR